MRKVNGRWVSATRVFRDVGGSLIELFEKVDEGYPIPNDGQIW
jgi:hypothetical protein